MNYFRMGIVGPSSSGKTMALIKDVLTHKDIFGKYIIYLICPSYQYQAINGSYKYLKLPEKDIYETCDNVTFDKVIERVKKDEKSSHLIILDDWIGSELAEKNSSLYRTIPLIRHYHCSIIMLSQYLMSIPKLVRNNIDCFILFFQDSITNKRLIRDEIGDSALAFYEKMETEKKPYSYIVIDLGKNIYNVEERFRNKY
jgi:hypothetical protein